MFTQQYLYHLKDLAFDYTGSYISVFAEKFSKSMPNTETFDKENQYEMVLLINALQKLWKLNKKEDCRKIELLIKTQMPPEVLTQIEVADWLVINWNNFEFPAIGKAC